jgi:hypothetical protein
MVLFAGWLPAGAVPLVALLWSIFATVLPPHTCCRHSHTVHKPPARAAPAAACLKPAVSQPAAAACSPVACRTTAHLCCGVTHACCGVLCCMHAAVHTVWPDDLMLEKLDHVGIVALIVGTPVTQMMVRFCPGSTPHHTPSWLAGVRDC